MCTIFEDETKLRWNIKIIDLFPTLLKNVEGRL